MRQPKAARLRDACCQHPVISEPALCPNDTVVFSGIPQFSNHKAILFDSTRPEDNGRLPDGIVIHGVEVRFCGQTPPPASLGQGLSLLIFVADLSRPRAKVRLADLVRQDGQRPLNLIKGPGQVLQIVLADPAGVWQQSVPAIEVVLSCGAIGPLSHS